VSSAAEEAELRRRYTVFRAQLRAAWGYAPAPYSGDLALIRWADGHQAPDGDERLGWGPLVAGRLECRTLPGDHYALLAAPGAAALAAALATGVTVGYEG
jgi:hypothetical protein